MKCFIVSCAGERVAFKTKVAQLEAALREIVFVQGQNPYDNSPPASWQELQMLRIAERALGSSVETSSKSCNCGWPRTTDGEHGDNCPAKIEVKQ
jgi:hypothetical protein